MNLMMRAITFSSLVLNLVLSLLLVFGCYNAVVVMETARALSIIETLELVDGNTKLTKRMRDHFYFVLSGEQCLALKYKRDPFVVNYFIDANLNKFDDVFNTMFVEQLQEDKKGITVYERC